MFLPMPLGNDILGTTVGAKKGKTYFEQYMALGVCLLSWNGRLPMLFTRLLRRRKDAETKILTISEDSAVFRDLKD